MALRNGSVSCGLVRQVSNHRQSRTSHDIAGGWKGATIDCETIDKINDSYSYSYSYAYSYSYCCSYSYSSYSSYSS